jgi:flagellar biogenesis protein FliO
LDVGEGGLILAQVFTVLVALAVVIGAIFLTYALTRRLSGKGGFVSGGQIKILDRAPAGKDKYLLLVAVSGKVFFLGVGENVSVLETWTDDFAAAETEQPELPFAAIWRGLIRRGPAGKESGKTDG